MTSALRPLTMSGSDGMTIQSPLLLTRAFLGLATFLALFLYPAHAANLDLSQAVVFAPTQLSATEKQAVTMLVDEVFKRTQVRWTVAHTWPDVSEPIIAVGTGPELERAGAGRLPSWDGAANRKEGFRLKVREPGLVVFVVGNDARGVMFGVGRLLRELHMNRQSVELREDLDLSSAPQCPLRGHQLGYRPKTNSYDAWKVADWEQYLRDLIVFGCNAVELIPPRSDDASDSPHFSLPPLQMMVEMSRLADRYGLDVWIWYPAMDRDYADPKIVAAAVEEWSEVFQRLPRIDAVFVPGGDPGHTEPKYLLALLERELKALHEFHPKAQMWVSPQSFNQVWLEEFLNILRTERPTWLSGIVYGPQVRIPLSQLRDLVPAQYPIRHYPDITHSRQCQYPVPDWDVAYAVTEARECVNPRPLDEAAIFRATWQQTIGFISYSEGCNDDVNKAVWSALGWDPQADVVEVLRQYGRYFIGDRMADGWAQGLLALERDWRGSLLGNPAVENTLAQFQDMERSASPQQLRNWRFQQGLLRAYYDAYTRRRLIYETELEKRALEKLGEETSLGSLTALANAERILNRATTERVAPALHERIEELGEALFQSIGMQLSVAKYKAIAIDRGAVLDTLDYPLNNRPWLKDQFTRIRRLDLEPKRLEAIRLLLDWQDPGPGGFYDDLGNPALQPHLVKGQGLARDPGGFVSPRSGFEEDLVTDDDEPPPQGPRRVSWMDHAETLYDAPLELHYTGLDPAAPYKVRVVYAGDTNKRRIRLVANEAFEVHPYLTRPLPFHPLEFEIPAGATAKGTLTLTWFGESGLGGNGRGCQVSEVWLMRADSGR